MTGEWRRSLHRKLRYHGIQCTLCGAQNTGSLQQLTTDTALKGSAARLLHCGDAAPPSSWAPAAGKTLLLLVSGASLLPLPWLTAHASSAGMYFSMRSKSPALFQHTPRQLQEVMLKQCSRTKLAAC